MFSISDLGSDKNKNKEFIFYLQGILFEKEKNFKEAVQSYAKSIYSNAKFFLSYKQLLNLLESTNQLDDFSIAFHFL